MKIEINLVKAILLMSVIIIQIIILIVTDNISNPISEFNSKYPNEDYTEYYCPYCGQELSNNED